MVALEKEFADKGLEILGFPCNQFNNREPGTDEEIEAFARSKGAGFKVFSKIEVNGKNACDLFRYLRHSSNLKGSGVDWNFGKFLVDREGKKIEYFASDVTPSELESHIPRFL